jgi:hypothetical protein
MTDNPTPRDATDGPDYGEHSDRAAEIGLLAHNVNAPQSAEADLNAAGIEHEHVADITAWTGQTVTVRRYKRDGSTRWVACWSERVAIDDVRWDSLIFESEPDQTDIETAAEIVNAQP